MKRDTLKLPYMQIISNEDLQAIVLAQLKITYCARKRLLIVLKIL